MRWLSAAAIAGSESLGRGDGDSGHSQRGLDGGNTAIDDGGSDGAGGDLMNALAKARKILRRLITYDLLNGDGGESKGGLRWSGSNLDWSGCCLDWSGSCDGRVAVLWRLDWLGLDWNALNWCRLNRLSLGRLGLDWCALGRRRLDWLVFDALANLLGRGEDREGIWASIKNTWTDLSWKSIDVLAQASIIILLAAKLLAAVVDALDGAGWHLGNLLGAGSWDDWEWDRARLDWRVGGDGGSWWERLGWLSLSWWSSLDWWRRLDRLGINWSLGWDNDDVGRSLPWLWAVEVDLVKSDLAGLLLDFLWCLWHDDHDIGGSTALLVLDLGSGLLAVALLLTG